MALSFPYALDFLSECLNSEQIALRLQRFDEMSGGGDGRIWSAQMAQPLWTATYSLTGRDAAHARAINAKINALDGTSQTMFWADPYYPGPASGVTTGLGGVTVASVRADRGAIALTGLPGSFEASAGDYLTIPYGSGRVYMGQLAEDGIAGAGGVLSQREIRPYLPFGIAAGASVQLVRPYFKAMVTDYTPFASFRGRWGDSASITIMQKP